MLKCKLHLPTLPIDAEIADLNKVVSARSNKMCYIHLASNTNKEFSLSIQAIVVKPPEIYPHKNHPIGGS